MPIVIITRNHAFCKQAKEISILYFLYFELVRVRVFPENLLAAAKNGLQMPEIQTKKPQIGI